MHCRSKTLPQNIFKKFQEFFYFVFKQTFSFYICGGHHLHRLRSDGDWSNAEKFEIVRRPATTYAHHRRALLHHLYDHHYPRSCPSRCKYINILDSENFCAYFNAKPLRFRRKSCFPCRMVLTRGQQWDPNWDRDRFF